MKVYDYNSDKILLNNIFFSYTLVVIYKINNIGKTNEACISSQRKQTGRKQMTQGVFGVGLFI